jgi:MOSC domain-containing protein YiiM
MPVAPGSPLARLLAGPVRLGAVAWIGLRPARKAAMVAPASARLVAGRGLEGDHYDSARNGPRQLTLVAVEDLAAIAAFLGQDAVAPGQLRRNLVTRGVNLMALKDRRFRIGDVVLQGSGECAPCGLMEITLMGWTAPERHRCARLRFVRSSIEGSRPWNRLRAFSSTRRRVFFSCMG